MRRRRIQSYARHPPDPVGYVHHRPSGKRRHRAVHPGCDPPRRAPCLDRHRLVGLEPRVHRAIRARDRESGRRVLFAPTLRAGHPTNPANKVLWVVRFPRDGHPLTVTARLSTDRRQLVRIRRPADSSPGEIYPSYIDLPKPGCWRLALAWGTHRASVDIQVKPAA
jgi:hypothetical protein